MEVPITSVSKSTLGVSASRGMTTSVYNTNGGSSIITSARASSVHGGSVSTSVEPTTSSTGVPTPSSNGGGQVQSK